MRLTVLGRSGRYPEKNGGSSAYLIENDGVTLLMDMGSGSISRFQNFASIGEIDGILFSHLHGDHMADFLPFNYMVAYKGKEITKPIEVYLPDTPTSVHDMMVSGTTKMRFHTIENGMHVEFGALDIEFIATKHPVECYAMRISDGQHTLLYTADTTLFEGIERLFEGADVVLGDACVLDSEWTEKSPHLSVKALATMSRGAKLILTHLPDNEDDIAKMLAEAESVHENVCVAEVMKTYTI